MTAEQTENNRPAGDRPDLKALAEAILFSADHPLSASRLAELTDAEDGHAVRRVVGELKDEYDAQGRAFTVEEVGGGFQILTRPEFDSWIRRLHSRRQQDTLSKAALETLAIVAYRQPITRAEVEDIRGVGAGHILRSLVDKRLLKIAGRSDDLGRALLYGTTRQFLEVFGLKSLRELPKRRDFTPPEPAEDETPEQEEQGDGDERP